MTVLLHGFWGQPADWNPILNHLPLSERVWVPDLYEAGPLDPGHDLEKWVTHFLIEVQDFAGAANPVQLVAYSLGGRLALNAILRSPQLFKRCLILSAAPYFEGNEEERAARLAWEEDWSRRFLRDDWAELERAWEDQPVLKSWPPGRAPRSAATNHERRKTAALREMLALNLKNWSVRLHPFGPSEVQRLPSTVEWAFGALDQKYVDFANKLRELPVQGQIAVIEGAGHRLISEAGDFIHDWIARGES